MQWCPLVGQARPTWSVLPIKEFSKEGAVVPTTVPSIERSLIPIASAGF